MATVTITAGQTADQIQTIFDGNPDGTIFSFEPGTYTLNHYLTLHQAQQAISSTSRGAILSGSNLYKGAIACEFGSTNNTISGFIVDGFTSDGTFPIAGLQVRVGGTIDDCEVRLCQNGIHVSVGNTITNNYVHHNRQYGIEGGPGDDILIEGNELSFNNTDRNDPNNDAGGSKIVGSTAGTHNLIWRNNYVHDNYGQGIWSDGNVYALYEDNRIEDNFGAGIDHEISWDAIIRNNTFSNNDGADRGQGRSCWYGSAIALNNSQNVEIYGNTIIAHDVNPLCMQNSTRSEPAWFPQALANINVHNNTITMTRSAMFGMVGDSMPASVVFNNNTYYTDALARWAYLNYPLTRAQWQAAGQDANGQFLPYMVVGALFQMSVAP